MSLDRVAQTHNLCTACMCQKNRTYKRVYAKVDTSELSFFLNVNRLNLDNCMLIQTFSLVNGHIFIQSSSR